MTAQVSRGILGDRQDMRQDQGKLIVRAMQSMHVNQRELAETLGVATRTVGRWIAGRTMCAYLPELAKHVYPYDAALAEDIARSLDTSTKALGIVPPPPPPPPPLPPPAPGPPPRPIPADSHLSDSIVCAAAEASDYTPKQVRPMLLAAFERAAALGLGVREVTAALRGAKGK